MIQEGLPDARAVAALHELLWKIVEGPHAFVGESRQDECKGKYQPECSAHVAVPQVIITGALSHQGCPKSTLPWQYSAFPANVRAGPARGAAAVTGPAGTNP